MRYRSLALPAVLVLAGVVALLANLNVIHWGSLYRLFDLWPLILVLAGIELLLRAGLPPRTASPLGLAAVAVAVIGALVYVALSPPAPLGQQSRDFSRPAAGVEKAALELSFGGAEVDVREADLGDTLYRVHLEYTGNQPSVTFDGSTSTLSIEDSHQGFSFWVPGARRRAEVTLGSAAAWSINVSGGASHATLDLVGLRLTDLSLSGGANNLSVTLGKPAGTVSLDISGGANSVAVLRPSGVPVHLHASGGFNSVRLDGHGGSSLGDTDLSSPGYDAAADRYEIDVSGGASNVTIGTG